MSDKRKFDPEESRENAETIGTELNHLEQLIDEQEFGKFFKDVREVTNLFKSLQLSRNDREELWAAYQELWSTVKAKQQEHADTLNGELDELEKLSKNKNYKDFWAQVKEISSLFKSLSIARDAREELWTRFQNACTKVKEEREAFERASDSRKHYLLRGISDAYSEAKSAYGPDDFAETRRLLGNVMDAMKESTLTKSDRDECWQAYCEANDELKEAMEKRQNKDYGEIDTDISIISQETGLEQGALIWTVNTLSGKEYNPHIALRLIKEAQQKVSSSFLSKDQRRELRETLQGQWDDAIQQIESQKEARQQKHEDWMERQQTRRSKLETWLENNEEFIERLEGQIEDLEDKIANSWNQNWADTARGWVAEKQEKINEVEEKNRDLRQQIEDIDEKLNG